jgi:hypothetical protein
MSEAELQQPEASPSPQQAEYSGDSDGLRAAADELLKKRGDNEPVAVMNDAPDDAPAVQPDEGISLRQGAKELADWREQRAQAKVDFEKAVMGEKSDGDEFDASLAKAKNAAEELGKVIAAEDAEADREAKDAARAAVDAAVPTASPVHMGALDGQLSEWLNANAAEAITHVRSTLAQQYPEVTDVSTAQVQSETLRASSLSADLMQGGEDNDWNISAPSAAASTSHTRAILR